MDRLALIKSRHAEAGGGDADKAWLIAEVERLSEALQWIVDIGFDHDGYHSAEDLGELVDELVQGARGAIGSKDAGCRKGLESPCIQNDATREAARRGREETMRPSHEVRP